MNRSLLFILADGARARLVARSRETGDFVTLREFDGSDGLRLLRSELRASPQGRSQESMSPTRRSVGRTDTVRHAKESFAAEAVDAAVEALAARNRDGVVLVAPARLIDAMRRRLGGRARLAGVLRKDLTKTPDHALGEWLAPLDRAIPS